MPAPILQFKRGATADLPGLALGEPGFTTDKYELWVGFDGTENNNKFFGSHRYWQRETNVSGGGLRFYESTTGALSGEGRITVKAPPSLDEINTNYVLPTDPQDNFLLVTNAAGVWRWTNEIQNVTLSGDIDIDGDIVSNGNLAIGGTEASFNTEIFDTQARIFNIGFSSTTVPTDTTWDLGVLFNYYKSGTRYRSGVFWDDSTGRIGIASDVSVINNEFESGTDDPIIDTTSVVYAPLILSQLWVNDCAGESVVITCADSERTLENISIDAGFY